jgi:hypothetical protein
MGEARGPYMAGDWQGTHPANTPRFEETMAPVAMEKIANRILNLPHTSA